LEEAVLDGPLTINSVIYAELSMGYSTIGALNEFVAGTGLQIIEIPKEALFLAGKAFLAYRRGGGTRTGVLPDFFIGAHAAASQLPLLTRDATRIKTISRPSSS
jgi:predicted nucleic acid-binding protein